MGWNVIRTRFQTPLPPVLLILCAHVCKDNEKILGGGRWGERGGGGGGGGRGEKGRALVVAHLELLCAHETASSIEGLPML